MVVAAVGSILEKWGLVSRGQISEAVRKRMRT